MPRYRHQAAGALVALLAASALAVPAAYAEPEADTTVAAIDAPGRSPTSVTLRIAGLGVAAVEAKVHRAARQVCRNAVANQDMGPLDYEGCREATHDAAMSDYGELARAARGSLLQAGDGLVLRVAAGMPRMDTLRRVTPAPPTVTPGAPSRMSARSEANRRRMSS